LAATNKRLRKLGAHEYFTSEEFGLDWDNLYLTQEQAEFRKKYVTGDINYEIQLFLVKGSMNFRGKLKAEFSLTEAVGGLHLDYDGTKFMSYEINGETVTEEKLLIWNGKFLVMPAKYLKQGKNSVVIEYETKYVTDGNGFHSMTDSDGE
jgi:hypothetical protein